MIPLAAWVLAACLAVDAGREKITAADLARALPQWSQAPPGAEIGYAPAPGLTRILRAPELRRLAADYGVAAEGAADVCFQRPVEPVPAERMLAAMRRRLPDARIQVLEASRAAAPAGEVDFPLSGLRGNYWFGAVAYGSGHRFTVWARVEVTVAIKRVVASADLIPGRPIDAAQLHIETRNEPPGQDAPGATPGELAGWIPRRRIAAGDAVDRRWLDPPVLVERGQVVKVEVVVGAARVKAEGLAESAGSLGQTISVQNPDSKRHYRARVEGAGRVSVKGTL
ncbi:MAG: flagellar basal body P-ring formation protein FlgA [Acidobacteriota bacterium]|nr:flagellar basal body P-ring formation protein FlgA [Acidobacteriota bacterium]